MRKTGVERQLRWLERPLPWIGLGVLVLRKRTPVIVVLTEMVASL